MLKKLFKTGEISRYFDVTRVTVIDWIKHGKLTAYETGGGHYRVMREDLINFFQQKNLPLPDELKSESEKKKILIVDDEKSVVESLKLILENLGADLCVEVAYDVFEAGFKLSRFLPDLVILDALMPGLNGNELCRFIKENPVFKNTKILGFTGFNEGKDELLESGADKVVMKGSPECDVRTFRREVCRLLDMKFIKVSIGNPDDFTGEGSTA